MYLKSINPSIKVIGCSPVNSSIMINSIKKGKIINTESKDTLSDGSAGGVEEGSITFHPSGLPHGPQPGKTEESIGAKEANEIAVMIDTFKPLQMTSATDKIDDNKYALSWMDK